MRVFPLIVGSLVLSLCSAGCAFPLPSIEGSGIEASEAREVAAFTAVAVNDSIAVEITLAPDQPQAVQVRGDDNMVPLLRTRVSAGELVLEMDAPDGVVSLNPNLPLVVTISTTALRRLEANDSATASADRLEGEDVLIASHDSSEVTVGAIVARDRVSISASDSSIVEAHDIAADDTLTVTAEDSAQVTVEGDAAALEAHVTDSSQLDAEELTVATAVIEGEDSAVAEVCATASLAATLSDSAAVSYGCDPEKVTKHQEDSSTLSAK